MSFTTLVTCAELASHLDNPDWRVFDCRHQLSDVEYGERAYAQGHLPGSFFVHLDRDLSGPMNGHNGRHPLPDPRTLADKLGNAGVTERTQIVAYDDDGGMVAGRLWWLSRWLGHGRVAVLDGGIQQWVREGRPLTTEVPKSPPASFRVALRSGWVVGAKEVEANISEGGFLVVDARGPDRFRGENETIDPVGGHIPGACNRFFRDNLDDGGRFRPAEELREDFSRVLGGVAPERAVMQCGSGVTACHNLLAMEIAGLRGARLYAGSWSEWCSDPSRPVER